MFRDMNWNQNIGTWDISSVVNMEFMFHGNTTFNNGGSPSIANWDTSSVVGAGMGYLFKGASAFNQPLSGWTLNVNSLDSVFYQASSFNQDLGNWNVSGVTVFNVMFTQSGFNNGGSSSINFWDMSNATSLLYMFAYCPFNQPLNLWSTSNVTNMKSMFEFNTAFNRNIQSWDVSNVDNFEQMFFGASAFNQNLSIWNTESATNMRLLFRDTPVNFDVSSWNVTGVTNFEAMFMGASNFNRSLNSWNVNNCTYFAQMLFNTAAYNQPITGWTLNNTLSGMNSMLEGSSGLSTENYSRTLIAFANDVYNDGGLPNAVFFGAVSQYDCIDYVVGQQYTNAVAARAYLVGLGWTISDGGQSGACASVTPTPTMTPSSTPSTTPTPTPTLTPTPSTPCTPWTPASISTELWLDSSDGSTLTLSGSSVTQWDDKSGNNRDATTTSGNEPQTGATFNGLTTIEFNSKWFDLPDFALGADATVFMLANRDTTGSFQTIMTLYNGTNSFAELWGSSGFPTKYMYYGVANQEIRGNTSLSDDTYYFTCIKRTYNAPTVYDINLYLNGSADGTGQANESNLFTDSLIGKDQYGAYFDGNIGEILVFNSALSDADREKVEGYLAWKWGMEGDLPIGHPYKNSAPCAPAPTPTPTPTNSTTPSVTPSLTPTSSVTPSLTPSPTPSITPSPSSPSFTLQYDHGFIGSSGGITKVFDILQASMSIPGCTITLTPYTSSSSSGGATQGTQTLTSACLNPSGYLDVSRRLYNAAGGLLRRTQTQIVTRVNGVIVDTYTNSTSTYIATGNYLGETYQPPVTPTNGDTVSITWTDTLI
jgi:surface protein